MGGAICSEMESAIIFVLSSIYRKRAGGIMLIMGNQEADDPEVRKGYTEDLHDLLETATEALKILIKKDREKS